MDCQLFMKAIEFYCVRLKRTWFVNPAYVLSFYEETTQWAGGISATGIEVKGNQGYGNHVIYVKDDVKTVAKLLDTEPFVL